ncbi:MAG: hypothetical protein E6R12_05270 [Sphingomonadales bacterium]|jgi:hypothetical protein|nr:MAG: hypothetical protein E6R12_05270 [Sphingomonadales bacterium]
MNKDCIKESLLNLTTKELEHATHNYLQFLEGTKLVPTEPIEIDEQAQAKFQANLASSFEQPVHSAEHKFKAVNGLDFGPKDEVSPGAVVCVDGRHFVIGVSTGRFICEGVEMMGLSQVAPFYAAIEGLKAGDTTEFRGREFDVRAVY